VTAWLSWKHGLVLRWRLQTTLTAAVYAGSLYIAWRAVHAGKAAGPAPALPSAKVHAILSGVQLAMAAAAAMADVLRCGCQLHAQQHLAPQCGCPSSVAGGANCTHMYMVSMKSVLNG
jgi:hypothetical protein